MPITCCKDCIPPKRYPGCHSACEEYKKQKAIHNAQKENERHERVPLLKNSDFDMLACIHKSRKYKR